MTEVGPDWFVEALGDAPVSDLVATLWEGGVRLAFGAADVEIGLDVHARREGPSYATTSSFTLYLRSGPMPPAAEHAVRVAIERLRARDPGGLVPVKGAERAEDDVSPALRVEARPKSPAFVDAMGDWLAVAATLPARLREAAALAWGAHRAGEPYPFVGALGAPVGDEALRAWVLERWPGGFTLPAFAAAWGMERGDAVMDVLAELRALGVAEVDDDGVRFHAGLGADVAIHAVLLWSPEVTAAARAVWGPVQGGERRLLDGVAAPAS